jgi:hypothetical protein
MAFYKVNDSAVVLNPSSTSPGDGWVSGSVQDAINAARMNGRPLLVLQGAYQTGPITIDSTVSGACEIQAVHGGSVFQFTGRKCLLEVDGIDDVTITGITFDGQNVAISDSSIARWDRFLE